MCDHMNCQQNFINDKLLIQFDDIFIVIMMYAKKIPNGKVLFELMICTLKSAPRGGNTRNSLTANHCTSNTHIHLCINVYIQLLSAAKCPK